MCDPEKIRRMLKDEVAPMNEAITKLTFATEVLEQSMVEMKEAHVKFFQALINQEGMRRELEHVQKENSDNKRNIDVLYGIIRDNEKRSVDKVLEKDKDSYSRLFVVLMAIFGGVLGATLLVQHSH
jgi:hypothetical protein